MEFPVLNFGLLLESLFLTVAVLIVPHVLLVSIICALASRYWVIQVDYFFIYFYYEAPFLTRAFPAGGGLSGYVSVVDSCVHVIPDNISRKSFDFAFSCREC
jgi:hypothetical protein